MTLFEILVYFIVIGIPVKYRRRRHFTSIKYALPRWNKNVKFIPPQLNKKTKPFNGVNRAGRAGGTRGFFSPF